MIIYFSLVNKRLFSIFFVWRQHTSHTLPLICPIYLLIEKGNFQYFIVTNKTRTILIYGLGTAPTHFIFATIGVVRTSSQGNSLGFLKVLDIHQTQVRVVCFYVYINVCTISRHRNGVKAVKIDDNQKRARQCWQERFQYVLNKTVVLFFCRCVWLATT